MIAFAVMGHNEAATLKHALDQAKEAAGPGDEVWFVDSASTDGSQAIARRNHVKHIRAPIGKGRAMRHAFELLTTEFICFVDADLVSSSKNIPLTLAEVARSGTFDMIIGDFDDTNLGCNTIGIYTPIVASLFPEASGRYGSKPLSGFRVIRKAAGLGRVPDDFGVESFLNISFNLSSARVYVCPVGAYEGRFLFKPHMGSEIAMALLDLAVLHKRLDEEYRPAWDEWIAEIVLYIASYRNDPDTRADFERGLHHLAARQIPVTRTPELGRRIMRGLGGS